MMTCYILLGSNLEEPVQQVKTALSELNEISKTKLIKQSKFYLSKPLGTIPQPDYVNVVAELNTHLTAHELLEELQLIEKKHGRVKTTRRWGPRTLDLDLLLYGNKIINSPSLIVPHPELKQRNFVLFPLAEINPDLILPDGIALSEVLKDQTKDGLEILTT